MKNSNMTRRALLTSIIALILSLSMLTGTTFAWFTDSVTSANNKIVAGTLDVDLYMWTAANVSTEITNESTPIFGSTSGLAQNDPADTLWEPGKTQTVYLSIKNGGTLDLKYNVGINVTKQEKELTNALQYVITPDAKYGDVTSWANAETTLEVAAVKPGLNPSTSQDVVLKAGEEHFFALSVHMIEEAGNEFQGGSVDFDITVYAGQLASEKDSFGKDYDELAEYPGTGFADVNAGASAVEIQVRGTDGYKDGSFNIPASAIAAGVDKLSGSIEEVNYNGNINLTAGREILSYEVSVTGIKDNITEPIKVMLKAPVGLATDTVKLYHYDQEIACTYNPTTGYVSFETTDFSPFSITYNPSEKYEAPEIPKDENDKKLYPTATVESYKLALTPGYSDTAKWGSYGIWAPTDGLDSKLEAAYVFKCPDYENATTEEKAIIDAYRYWNCDFYVSLNKDLGKNEIFLGGNYGSFGWVGFHNGDVTLKANEELPLLGSVTSNPWTYADVESFVSEFICGVGDVNDALEGATFTVKLRLTNPEKTSEYYDVNTVTHTFGGNSVIDGTTVVTTGEGLQDAVNKGDTNIILGDDIDLSQGIVIPGN